MDKEELKNSEIFNAASIALSNGFIRCYGISEMGHYMFIQGYKYAKTGVLPTSDLDKISEE